jgi:hypothetical protein
MALEDESVRRRVRSGDLSALGDLQLSAKEEDLVKGAAEDEAVPKVAGFDWSSPKTFAAMTSVKGNIFSPAVSDNYTHFVESRFGGIQGVAAAACQRPPKGEAPS